MTEPNSERQRDTVRKLLQEVVTAHDLLGAEFLDAEGTRSCIVGAVEWEDDESVRGRRIEQEMRVFREFDRTGTVALWNMDAPDLIQWESDIEDRGHFHQAYRVGDVGVVHGFFQSFEALSIEAVNGLERAAEAIEGLLGDG